MSNRGILFPLRPRVHDVRTDAHIIPDDLACQSEGSLLPTLTKRTRRCIDEGENTPTGPHALETLRSLGCLTHSVTSTLIRRDAADLNGKLLAIQEQHHVGKGQKRSRLESEPTEPKDARILTPSSGEHPGQGKSTDGQFETAGDDTDDDVNVLWRRVNRNKSVAVMLRDFEVLHRLLLSEIKDMMQDDDKCS
jgi:hypothetical protein